MKKVFEKGDILKDENTGNIFMLLNYSIMEGKDEYETMACLCLKGETISTGLCVTFQYAYLDQLKYIGRDVYHCGVALETMAKTIFDKIN
jgi:hypothetical protein